MTNQDIGRNNGVPESHERFPDDARARLAYEAGFKGGTIGRLLTALQEVLEYAEDREDIDDHGGPNAWMQVAQLCREALR